MTKNIIVVDLDGTLCDSSHREHLAQAGKWNEFHSLLHLDDPNEAVATLTRVLVASESEFIVIGLTGRNERYRLVTEQWLALHEIYLDDLLMRPDDNYESDHELKPRMLEAELVSMKAHILDVLFILEDRDKVVEAWRNKGYACWQVKSGGY